MRAVALAARFVAALQFAAVRKRKKNREKQRNAMDQLLGVSHDITRAWLARAVTPIALSILV
ncbi:MAG: hypothetical protein MHM6MM_007773 [Cercozoa sp. M6MM]